MISLLHSSPSSSTQRFLFQLSSSILWFPVVISGCMSIYVVGASRQGIQWFSPKHNPYLCLQLGAGCLASIFSVYLSKTKQQQTQNQELSAAATTAEILVRPPKPVILLAATCWSFYSALITRQRWHFREWRYIVSAHAPLAALFGVYVFL